LTNLDGLSALTRVGGYLSIIGHPALTDLDGLSALTRVGGDIRIGGNDVLTNLDGLSALVSVPGNLNVGDNASLTSLDGLSALTSVGGFFGFINNTALSSFSGLSALTSVGGSLGIMSHPALTNLDGLSALTRVGQDVWIADNAALASCSGLIALLDPVDDSAPGPGPGEAGIPDVANGLVIGGNLPGCNSAAEILATAPLATINAGLSDAWYNPETPGQGFIVIVFPEIEKIFMAWFTYDTERPPEDVMAFLGEPGHRWRRGVRLFSCRAPHDAGGGTTGADSVASSGSPASGPASKRSRGSARRDAFNSSNVGPCRSITKTCSSRPKSTEGFTCAICSSRPPASLTASATASV